MARLSLSCGLAAVVALAVGPGHAAADVRCRDDAILVFDASGSMAGTDMNAVKPHIAKVREALATVLPSVAPRRDLGLMVYGPGNGPKCTNIELRLKPGPNSAETIMSEVNGIVPAGQTPLTSAVKDAAEVLRFREKPSVVVLLTDGEETCGGDPCRLARQLRAEGNDLTIHVIGFKVAGSTWLKPEAASSCMAAETGGLSLTAKTKDELIAALQKTLTCPLFSEARRKSPPGN
jgi:Ca-activated chloride channel family protein